MLRVAGSFSVIDLKLHILLPSEATLFILPRPRYRDREEIASQRRSVRQRVLPLKASTFIAPSSLCVYIEHECECLYWEETSKKMLLLRQAAADRSLTSSPPVEGKVVVAESAASATVGPDLPKRFTDCPGRRRRI